jgi:oligoribonuclease (3'-5' exoribonuclease)
MSTNTKTILIIDVATSGFRADTDTILEVSCILVDAGTLNVLDTCNVVIHHPEGSVTAPDFHSALLAECAHPDRLSMRAAEGFLLAGQWTTADVVCNRALDYFDLKFLAKHMPTLHRAMLKGSHTLELKALEVLHVARGYAPYESGFPRTFRASDDAIAAYEELVHYMSNVTLIAPAFVDHDGYHS